MYTLHTKNASCNKAKVTTGMPLLTSKQKLKYLISSLLIHSSLEKQNFTSSVWRLKDIKNSIGALYWKKKQCQNAQQIYAWYYLQKDCVRSQQVLQRVLLQSTTQGSLFNLLSLRCLFILFFWEEGNSSFQFKEENTFPHYPHYAHYPQLSSLMSNWYLSWVNAKKYRMLAVLL